jgi:hypothetical protein
MLPASEYLVLLQRVKDLASPPHVTLAEAEELARSVSGLAKLSGYSRMQIHRLVKSGKITPGTEEALRWSWRSAQKNYPQGVPPLNLRRNHPARRAMLALLRSFNSKSGSAQGARADMRTVSLVARMLGEPKPSAAELSSFIRRAADLENQRPDFVRLVGVARKRKQVPLANFHQAINRLREKSVTPSTRSIGRELGVNASTVSRWFSRGGHLYAHRQQLADACFGPRSGTGHKRNGRPFNSLGLA